LPRRKRLACRVNGAREFDVGHDFPARRQIAREEKDGEHAGEALIPPKAIFSGDALRGNEAGDEQRRVGGERRGPTMEVPASPGDVTPEMKNSAVLALAAAP